MFKIGEKVKLPEYSGFRSMYPVYMGAEVIAFLSYPEGWAGSWTLHKLMLAPADYPADKPQVDGCIPVIRRGGLDGSVRIYRKDGKAGALELLADPKSRENFKTRAQLIDEHTQTYNTMRRTLSNLLASSIKIEARRIAQRETVTQLLAMDSLLVGEQRLVMLDMLRELSTAVDTAAKDVAGNRKALEEHEAEGNKYEPCAKAD